jgi:uncharacterized membrane protein YeaQ/YmgE (transglycosylase-associated protein family)
MHIVMFLLFGFLVGAVARFLTPGQAPGGWVVSIVIGIVGSMLIGVLGQSIGLYRQGEVAGFIMSVIGAMIVTAVYQAARGRRRTA